MDPAPDVLYRIHQFQAARRGHLPLAYSAFHARLPTTYETDLTALLLPPVALAAQPALRCPSKFELGHVCITANAAQAVPPNEVMQAIARHAAGDWGSLAAHDRQENERALGTRGRLLSIYQASNGNAFWVITDAGWATTSVILPEDY